MELIDHPQSMILVYQDKLGKIQAQEPRMVKLATHTLTWLLYSQRPLEIAEFFEVHHFSFPKDSDIDVSLIIEACQTLVRVGETITFTHLSAKEFLETNSVFEETAIATNCLQYLIDSDIDQAASQETIDDQIRSHPFLLYAASYWARHINNTTATNGTVQDNLKKLCLTLLNNKARVASLCQIVFSSRPRLSSVMNGLVKSSWLHLVSYFGLDWAINLPISREPVNERDEWGRTPLHIAAENGFTNCVDVLLTPESLNDEDLDGKTVWHYAAMSGNLDVIRLLVDRNSSPLESSYLNTNKPDKTSALEYAVYNGDAKIISMLFPLYASKPGDDLNRRALKAAVEAGKTDIVEYLLSHGEEPAYEYLIEATYTGFEDVIRLLLDYGTELDNSDDDGDSALLIAAGNGRNKILELLIWNGADIDRAGRYGCTALSLAVEMGNIEGIRILLRVGARPEGSIENYSLPVYAARQDMVDILKLLLDAGAETRGVVSAAAELGRAKVLQLLLGRGLLPDPGSNDGQDLLAVEKEAGYSFILSIWQSGGFEGSSRPVYSVSSEDTVDGDKSFGDITSSSIDENSESPTSKQIQEERNPVIRFQAKSPDSLHLSEPQALQRSVQPQPLSCLDSRLNNTPVPFLLLSEPIPIGCLRLGCIVANPRDPLSLYVPKDPGSVSNLSHLIKDDQFNSTVVDAQDSFERTSTTRFALRALLPLLNVEAAQTRSIAPASKCVLKQHLHDHEKVLSQIFNNQSIRSEIFSMAENTDRKQLFIIVGLLAGVNQRASDSDVSTQLGLNEAARYEHAGEKIFAIKYRKVRVQRCRPHSIEIFVEDYFDPKPHERLF